MKTLVCILALAVLVLSNPLKPHLRDPKVSVSQSTSGSYSIHYNTGKIRRDEKRFQNGEVIGSYSYVDPDGKIRVVKYTAGVGGFQILPGSNLPYSYVPKVATDTAKAAPAKIQHAWNKGWDIKL